jgi:hypothetical protein
LRPGHCSSALLYLRGFSLPAHVPPMKLPRLKLWTLCLAVAVSAVVIKLAMMAGPILTFSTSVIFLGPLSGIVLDRHRGGTGIAGGIIGGILSGVALSVFMTIHAFRLGHPVAWYELPVSTIVFGSFEAFCGWLWGRRWHLSMANHAAANPKENGT